MSKLKIEMKKKSIIVTVKVPVKRLAKWTKQKLFEMFLIASFLGYGVLKESTFSTPQSKTLQKTVQL